MDTAESTGHVCACGCGSSPNAGHFLPGHDQKLRAALEAKIGGLLELKDALTWVEEYLDGEITSADLGSKLRKQQRRRLADTSKARL